MSSPKQTVLVGIALGSNIASVSFLLPGKNSQPTPLSGWPDSEDVKSLVVPIRVKSYLASSDELKAPNIDWGYSVKPGAEGSQDNILRRVGHILGTGLDLEILEELEKREGNKKYGASGGGASGNFNLTLISSFVDAIKIHIEKRIGLAFGNEILKNAQYDVCITVPPWWTTSQRERYHKGLKDVYTGMQTICEPTASLVYYLNRNKRHPLQPQDVFVHCNVEEEITTIAAYTVDQKSPELRLSPRGSEIMTLGEIDFRHAFHNLVETRLLDYLHGTEPDPRIVLEEFDKLKSGFVKFLPRMDGVKTFKFRLPWKVPDSIWNSIVDSQMTMTGHDLRTFIFDPLLSKLVLRLPASGDGSVHILLTGILSECPYVSKFIEKHLSDTHLNTKVKLLKSVNGITSSSRGAALYLDVGQNKSFLVALPPCIDTKIVTGVESRLSALTKIEDDLGKAPPADNSLSITRYRCILAERIARSGYTPELVRTFTSLGRLYAQSSKLSEQKALLLQFEDMFRPTIKEMSADGLNLNAIHLAALHGAPPVLDFLVDCGCPVNHPAALPESGFNNWTPLHFAVSVANVPIVEWLLQNGADVAAKTAKSQTPLHVVISRSHDFGIPKAHKVIRLLLSSLSHKPALNFEDENGMTALDLAKEQNLSGIIQQLMQQGATENPQIEIMKLEAVSAAKTGNPTLLQQLLQQSPSLVHYVTPEKWSLLHFAAESGNSQAIRHLLNAGANINHRNIKDETPLHLATMKGHEIIVALLCQKQADVALANSSGDNALHIAVDIGNIVIVNTLVQTGANLNTPNSRGRAPLHIAAEKDFEPLMRALIDRGADVEAQTGKSPDLLSKTGASTKATVLSAEKLDMSGGWRALHIVAYNGQEHLVKLLVRSVAEVNVRDLKGYTPAHRAAQNGHEKVLALLLKHGADSKTVTLSNRTPLHDAARSGQEPVLKLLLKTMTKANFIPDDTGRTALHEAVEAGQEAIVKTLLKKGFPPNPRTIKEGYTPLSIGVLSGSIGIVKMLLKNGADANVVHNDRSTILHLAAKSSDPEAMVTLFLPKSNVMARDDAGATPLHAAVESGRKEAIPLLVRNKADINAQDERLRTPFFVSVLKGNVAISILLAENGARLEIPDLEGSTPLHLAVTRSDMEHAKFLFSRKVDMKPLDGSGRTPLHYAVENNDLGMCRLLLDSGARPDACSDPALPPLFIAVEKDREEALTMLINKPNSGIYSQMSKGSLSGLHGETTVVVDQEGWTPLHLAAWHGFANIVTILLQNGADPNAKSKASNATPLHLTTLAFERLPAHVLTATVLLDHGADPYAMSEGRAIIHMAAMTGHDALLTILIERGVRLSQLDAERHTALSHAIRLGHHKTCILLIDSGFDKKRPNNETHLCSAASANNLELLKLLISRGGDVNQKTSDGSTPLHLASINGYEAIVTHLLRNGADVSLKTTEGRTALDFGAENGHVAAVAALLDGDSQSETLGSIQWQSINRAVLKGQNDTARLIYERCGGMKNRGSAVLHWAVQEGLLRLLETIVDFGADVNISDDHGWSPLQNAAASDQEAIASFLLERGVDVDHRGPKSRTALHQAALNNSHHTLKLLLAKEADAAALDEDGSTALHLASERGHTEVIDALLIKSPDIKIKTVNGKSAIALAMANNQSDVLRLLLQKEAALGDGQHTELITAALSGNEDLVRLLVDNGANVNARSPLNHTAVRAAAEKGYESIFKILLQAGADINPKDNDGYTPLQVAAYHSKVSMTRLLIDSGADIDMQRPDGSNALLDAAARGDLAIVQLLVEAKANLSLVTEAAGYTAIHQACSLGRDEVVRFLLQAGIGLNVRTKAGGSPLHIATRNGQLSTAKLLVEHGADVSDLTLSKETPLHYAARADSPLTMKYLLEKGADVNAISSTKQTPLYLAAMNATETSVRFLIEEGADTSLLDDIGYSCFHAAAEYGRVLVAKYLLGKNMSMELKSTAGWNPLHLAVCAGRDAFVRFLLEEGVDINALTADKSNSLHLSALNGHANISRLLLQRGIGVDSINSLTNTSLQIAVINKHLNVAEVLLEFGANPNAYNGTSRPALLSAAEKGHREIVQLLVRKRANLKIKTKEKGWEALHIAADYGHLEILKVLADAKQGLNVRNDDGETPLIMATRSSHEPCVRFLLDRGAPIRSTNNMKVSAFLQAARTGSPAIIKLLAGRGADTKGTAGQGLTALHYAIENKKDELIDPIIDADTALLEIADDLGWTPLHRAAARNTFATKRLLARGALVDPKLPNGFTPLIQVAQGGRLEEAELLIKAGASLESVDNVGWAPIHYATFNSRVDVLKLLVSQGADLNLQTTSGHTSFHIAAEHGLVDMMSLLLEIGGGAVDVNGVTKKGLTALHISAERGKSEAISFLIQKGANLKATTPTSTWIALHSATHFSQLDTMSQLIKAGIAIDSRSKDGYTSLYWAVNQNLEAPARRLLEEGASPDVASEKKWTALHHASYYNHLDLVKLLLNFNANPSLKTAAGWTPLHMTCELGYKEIAEVLLQEGALVNIAGGELEYTPLHLAVWHKHKELSSLLLRNAKGVNVNAKTNKGHTPLHLAVQLNLVDIGRELILHGAEINAKSELGFTPLHIAAQYGSEMMARLLLAKSTCLIDAVTNDKRTPLHIAAQFKQLSIARLLILRRANLNRHSDDAGATPLHTSAKYGAIEVARALVAARPDFDARDNFKLTALMRAVVENQDEMVEFLAAYCNVNAKGVKGWTALHWAAKEDNPRACRVLLAKGASKFIKNEQGLTPNQIAFKLQKLKVMGLL